MANFDYSTLNLEDVINVEELTTKVEELEDSQNDDGEFDDQDDKAEFDALTAILDKIQGDGSDHKWRGDWYPSKLIRDSHFEDYMDEMLESCGEIPKDLPSYLSITVDYVSLQMDYSSVDIGRVTYWFR